MLKKLQARIAREESGFTLLELLVVIVILGILLAIAVPSYLGFKGRSEKAAAQSDVRAVLPSVEAFASDRNNGYANLAASGMAKLKASYDSGIDTTKVSVVSATANNYCISGAQGSWRAWVTGPGGTINSSHVAGFGCK